MNNIMYLYEDEHSEREPILFLFRAEIWREIIWKIGLKNLISSLTCNFQNSWTDLKNLNYLVLN